MFLSLHIFLYRREKFSVSGLCQRPVFLHNYAGGRWNHTWTLAVEEHFYILLTVFFLVCIRYYILNLITFAYTYLFLVLFCLSWRVNLHIQHPGYDFDLHYTFTHIRLDALFFGVFLSYQHFFRQENSWVLFRNIR